MTTRTLVGKLAATVLGGALLAGISVGTALAAPAASTARSTTDTTVSATAAGDPQGPDCNKIGSRCYTFYLYNNTPYTFTWQPQWSAMKYLDGNQYTIGERNWHDVQPAWGWGTPPQTLQPGEVMRFVKLSPYPFDPRSGTDVWLTYGFTDADGKEHAVQVHADERDLLTSFSHDCPNGLQAHCVPSTGTFHMEYQPGAPANSVGAFLNTPAEITIDAKTNPNGAANVMTLFPDATDKSYKINGQPFWEPVGKVQQGSAKLINATSSEAKLTSRTGTINSHTVSTSTEVSWETTLELAKVAKLSVEQSLTGGKEWGTEDEVSNGATMTVESGLVGWFDKTTQVQSVNGDFNFTAYNGAAHYHVKNVKVSAQGLAKPGYNGIPVPGTAFTVHTEPFIKS